MAGLERRIESHVNGIRALPRIVFVYYGRVAGHFVARGPPSDDLLLFIHFQVHLVQIHGVVQLSLHLEQKHLKYI